jgi:hypothetical protein
MKKSILLLAIVTLLTLVIFLSRRHFEHSRDGRIYQNLAGKWTMSFGSLTIQPAGSYVFQFTVSPDSGIVTNEGAFQVKNEFLINTLTKSYRKNAQLPQITATKIIMVNAREMIIDTGSTNKLILRKDAI